jgi:transposase
MLQQGKSVREVATTLNISLGKVSKLRQENQENIPDPKMGAPSKVSKQTQRLLARQFDTGKILTLRDGQRLVKSTEGVQVHIDSIRNYLRQEGLKAYVQQKKPLLTREQIAARKDFAERHLKWTVEDWKNVMFSDETTISRMGTYGRKFYYKRPERKRLEPHQVKQTKQCGGGKMMVWGCMTYYGVGDACWYQGKIDAKGYIDVLDEYVLQSRDWYGLNPDAFVFQQDNASVHTAHVVKEYFLEKKLDVLEWPANSPDMNPIEHLWGYMKARLDEYPEAPRNMQELWERVQDVWTTIPSEYIKELYESMPRRIKALYDNKGGLTKY